MSRILVLFIVLGFLLVIYWFQSKLDENANIYNSKLTAVVKSKINNIDDTQDNSKNRSIGDPDVELDHNSEEQHELDDFELSDLESQNDNQTLGSLKTVESLDHSMETKLSALD
jgi:hypothetical protein